MQPEIIDYFVLNTSNPTRLEKQVKDLMKDGWQPIGGIAIGAISTSTTYFGQALVNTNNLNIRN